MLPGRFSSVGVPAGWNFKTLYTFGNPTRERGKTRHGVGFYVRQKSRRNVWRRQNVIGKSGAIKLFWRV